ncbi:uncharacterized protein LOC34619462 [Cyclospora cayetanensis]|uniref:1-phosphatidylinositol 4-kinase n=1 Tax=Cyclospora cayetanensis TaxID=88456 RepID=A0A6P6S3U7_9EIME|nr:uncharacterized protein LOC34619462 [Cyclospora cayetanensis]
MDRRLPAAAEASVVVVATAASAHVPPADATAVTRREALHAAAAEATRGFSSAAVASAANAASEAEEDTREQSVDTDAGAAELEAAARAAVSLVAEEQGRRTAQLKSSSTSGSSSHSSHTGTSRTNSRSSSGVFKCTRMPATPAGAAPAAGYTCSDAEASSANSGSTGVGASSSSGLRRSSSNLNRSYSRSLEEAAQKMTQEVEMALVNSKPLAHAVYAHPSSERSSTASCMTSSSASSLCAQQQQQHKQQQQQHKQQQQQQAPQRHTDLFKRHTLLHLLWQQQQQQQITPQQLQRLSRAVCAADAAPAVSTSETLKHPDVATPEEDALGNPLSLTTLSPPNLCCGTCNRASSSTGSGKGCTDSCVAVELHQFVMKQRRCDYFNGLNHFVSLLIDASNILAAEPDRSIRPSLLYGLCENLNSWLLARRLFVAANGGDFSLAGLTVPLEQIGGELWVARRERLRRKSPYGKLRSWDIKCILVKGGDDLRQELLASQLVRQFKAIFEEARLPLWLRPYEILVTGSNSGIMECIPDTCSVDLLKKKHGVDSIATVFDTLFSDNPFEAKKNFIESHAAYSLVSYLLQVKDRHNGNLLLDAEGHVIHIDYGFLLSNSPGNINFETAPFKLTQEFLDVMDGETSDNYEYFRTLIIRGFLEARKHADRIILMVEMMLSATKMPCFSGGPEYTLSALKERFMLGLAEDACIERVVELIDISVNNFRTVHNMTLAASVEPPIRDQSFRPPPACFGLGQLTRHNVLMLKELNLATIPVVYGEEYYDYLIVHPTFCRLAYLGDVMVGGITCRVETNPDGVKQLYIMTLSVLKPYRRHGIGELPRIDSLTLPFNYHISSCLDSQNNALQCALQGARNHESKDCCARRFYEKRGFKSVSREENHYPDMEPPHAVYMQCQLPWAFKGAVPLVMPDFDATKHNLSQFKQPDHK